LVLLAFRLRWDKSNMDMRDIVASLLGFVPQPNLHDGLVVYVRPVLKGKPKSVLPLTLALTSA
jgi:hypothetical protein